jgi:large subunit ribosomal protein L10
MTRAEKGVMIQSLTQKIKDNEFFYVADSSTLTVDQVNKLRAICFEKGVHMQVVKNTLAIKALQQQDNADAYGEIIKSLVGPSTLFFTEVANTPAKIIKEFRKTSERPLLKAAYIDSSVYIGDDQIDALASLKSKEELIGEVITLLQSPMQNVLGSLKSGSTILAGLLKTLGEREG